jgi:hypothetical protein
LHETRSTDGRTAAKGTREPCCLCSAELLRLLNRRDRFSMVEPIITWTLVLAGLVLITKLVLT